MKWLKVSQTDDPVYNILMMLNDPAGANQADAETLIENWVDNAVTPVVNELDPEMGEGRVWACVNEALTSLFMLIGGAVRKPITKTDFYQALANKFVARGMDQQVAVEVLKRIR